MYLEGAEQALVDTHHCACVVEFTAVIRRAEECDELALGEELVAIFHDLMSSTDEIHVVLLQETRYDVGAECEGDTSVVFAPSRDVLVRIGPQEIAEKSTVGDLFVSVRLNTTRTYCSRAIKSDRGVADQESKTGTYISWSHHTANLLHGVQVGTEASVHGEDLLVDDGGNW